MPPLLVRLLFGSAHGLLLPKTLVSGGLKLPQSAAAKKEFVSAALTGILADARAVRKPVLQGGPVSFVARPGPHRVVIDRQGANKQQKLSSGTV